MSLPIESAEAQEFFRQLLVENYLLIGGNLSEIKPGETLSVNVSITQDRTSLVFDSWDQLFKKIKRRRGISKSGRRSDGRSY